MKRNKIAAAAATTKRRQSDQIVKNCDSRPAKKHAFKQAPKLVRTTFRTDRTMDFFTPKELITQTGHPVEEWHLVILKELLDNCLDACEEADIAPIIDVTADASGIAVKDNGPGLPESSLQAAMNFSIRASNREAYVAPDRGAQGNALKTLLPMPIVLDPEHGKLIIEAHSKRHVLRCSADPISQRPVIDDAVTKLKTKGTKVRTEWSARKNADGRVVWPFDDEANLEGQLADSFRHLVEGTALLNPHATIRLYWFGRKSAWEATNPGWQKWKPNRPTSAQLRIMKPVVKSTIISANLRTQRGFSYTPSTVINPLVFVSHLFLRPGYGHYYFGDYYGSNYANAGFSPWFAFQSSRRGYDPIYANQRWQNRRDRGWEQRAQANFQNLRDNENGRPPRNWAAQTALAKQGETSDRTNIAVVAPLDELAQRKDAQLRLQTVNPAERQQFGQRGQAYRKYLQQRQQLEANAARAPGGEPAAAAGAARKKFTRSPYVGPSADQLGRDNAPPQRHQVLKPDLQVQPQPRTRGGQPATGQGQPQRQGVNQGNRQGASAGKSQDQGANRGSNRQGASRGQQQGGTGGQQQGKPQTQSTNESKKKNKN